jgi:uncharacterized membrane protein YkvA (DUF1232 family)
MIDRLKQSARLLKQETLTLYVAARHPGTPWYARTAAVLVVGYALSPFDVIPDFIPVLGLLDDLVVVPVGIWLVLRLVPADVIADCRVEARVLASRPVSRAGAIAAVTLWVLAAGWAFTLIRGLSSAGS